MPAIEGLQVCTVLDFYSRRTVSERRGSYGVLSFFTVDVSFIENNIVTAEKVYQGS